MKTLFVDNCSTATHSTSPAICCSGLARLLSCVFLTAQLLLGLAHAANVQGQRVQWYPLTLDFYGPQANESDELPNPFLDYRLTVTLQGPSGQVQRLPGFFAGNGNGEGQGNVWRARFAAEEAGHWTYTADFRRGSEIAISQLHDAGEAVSFHGETGGFDVTGVNPSAPGFQREGRLDYTGEHYLKFRNGSHWIKTGTDSPENFLAYQGFDGTQDSGGARNGFLHQYAPHIQDWRQGDPWFSSRETGIDSRGIIGALNYLADQEVNSIYFLPMNLGGDGYDTHPFLQPIKTRYHKTHFDISKLHQWHAVLLHAQHRAIALNIVLNETELENRNWHDDGRFGLERKLYYREMVARFGFLLAAKWNISEENNFPIAFVREAAQYLHALDWTNKPISVHTPPDRFENYYDLLGNPIITATSIQYSVDRAGEYVEAWRNRSREAGVPWVIDMDENDIGLLDSNADDLRRRVLYDVLFSGGNLEWYFGFGGPPLGGDVSVEDFRTRQAMWEYTRYARRFMHAYLPFHRMQAADYLVEGENGDFGGAEVFAAENEVYAVYLPVATGNPTIRLPTNSEQGSTWRVRWYNPQNGQFEGQDQQLNSNGKTPLGAPPSRQDSDWVVLITSSADSPIQTMPSETIANEATTFTTADDQQADTSSSALGIDSTGEQSVIVGQSLSLVIHPSDTSTGVPSMYILNPPLNSTFDDNRDGTRTLRWTPDAEQIGLHTLVVVLEFSGQRSENPISLIVTGSPAIDSPTTNNQTTELPTTLITSTSSGNLAPELTVPRNVSTKAGTPFELRVVPVDPEGIVPIMYIELLPEGAEFADNFDGTRTLRWTPSVLYVGTHNLVVVAQDAIDPSLTIRRSLSISVFD